MMRVYVDTETTGLDAARDEIIEVAAVADNGAEFHAFSNPGEFLLAKIKERPVNRVPLDEVLSASSPQHVADTLRVWLAGLGEVVLHAYNVHFDRGFLSRSPWSLTEGWGECVMMAAARGRRWIKLVDAVERFGLTWSGEAHRALDDARMARRLHEAILRERV